MYGRVAHTRQGQTLDDSDLNCSVCKFEKILSTSNWTQSKGALVMNISNIRIVQTEFS